MGPKLLQHKGKKTTYTLRLILFGGYCSMEGEDKVIPSAKSTNKRQPSSAGIGNKLKRPTFTVKRAIILSIEYIEVLTAVETTLTAPTGPLISDMP